MKYLDTMYLLSVLRKLIIVDNFEYPAFKLVVSYHSILKQKTKFHSHGYDKAISRYRRIGKGIDRMFPIK